LRRLEPSKESNEPSDSTTRKSGKRSVSKKGSSLSPNDHGLFDNDASGGGFDDDDFGEPPPPGQSPANSLNATSKKKEKHSRFEPNVSSRFFVDSPTNVRSNLPPLRQLQSSPVNLQERRVESWRQMSDTPSAFP
jgi:hypothetical protein